MMSDRIGKYAATQSVAEIGLGSILHSLHIPLAGHLLSLNQGMILVLVSKKAETRREGVSLAAGVSSVAAVLKALSPAGKRLTPMLAISMQGFLFSLGLLFAGLNPVGMALGMMLLSFWGFAQPLIFVFLLFGSTPFEGVQKVWLEIAHALRVPAEYGWWILGGAVAVKVFAGMVLALVAWFADPRFERRYLLRVRRWSRSSKILARERPKSRTAWLGAFRDLLSPWFLISLGLSTGFFAASRPSGDLHVWLYGLRSLALGWLFFWGIRAFPASWSRRALARFPQLQAAVDQVLRKRSRS